MTNKLTFCFFLFALVTFSCRQNISGTYDYSSLQVDTNKINIFKWDSALYAFPKFSEPLSLTNDDLRLVDSLVIDAVDKFNKANSKRFAEAFNKEVPIDSFIIDLSKYKRQYFPYTDNNGKRGLHLICFSKTFSDWRKKAYFDGNRAGISRFSLRINLSEKNADEFSIGGYG